MSQPTATSERTAFPAVLLDGARAAQARQRAAEVEVLVAVADWADAHTDDGVVADQYGPFGLLRSDAHLLPGADVFGELGGPGAPLVSEFCVVEIAAALGLSTDSGRRLVGEAVELRHGSPGSGRGSWSARCRCGGLGRSRRKRTSSRSKVQRSSTGTSHLSPTRPG